MLQASPSTGAVSVRRRLVILSAILGLDAAQAQVAAVIAAVIVVIMLVIARPLLLASVDGVVARARGVPVLVLGVVFLVALGGVAAEATQAVGPYCCSGSSLHLPARPTDSPADRTSA